MAEYTADFELGSNGATITTGDPGSLTAWTRIFDTYTYSNAQSAHGSLSAACPSGGSPAFGLVWDKTFPSEFYGRFYLYATALPTTNTRVFLIQGTTSGHAGFIILTDGTVMTTVSSGSNIAGAVPIAINQWVRLEYHFVRSATVGLMEVRLFNTKDSSSSSEIISPTANRDTDGGGGSIDHTEHGSIQFGPWGSTFWLDDIVDNATSYPGPVVTATTFMPPARIGRVRGG